MNLNNALPELVFNLSISIQPEISDSYRINQYRNVSGHPWNYQYRNGSGHPWNYQYRNGSNNTSFNPWNHQYNNIQRRFNSRINNNRLFSFNNRRNQPQTNRTNNNQTNNNSSSLFNNINERIPTPINSNIERIIRPTLELLRLQTEISSFQNESDEEILCSICRENIENGNIIRKIKTCNHMFHMTCIDRWFERHITCPHCRYDIREGVEGEEEETNEISIELSNPQILHMLNTPINNLFNLNNQNNTNQNNTNQNNTNQNNTNQN